MEVVMKDMRELLAGCLRESVNGYVVDALIEAYPNISELMNASEDEIRLIKGIGAVKAKQLQAILLFVKKVNMPEGHRRIIIRTPKDVYDMVRGEMEFLEVEHFNIVGLSTKNTVIFNHTVSIGSLNATIVHPREVFKIVIKRACASCILVHNHPSGDPIPSQEDIELTKKMIKAGNLLDIQVLDHVIVGSMGQYISFKEERII